jgi:hypothetical protein
MEDYRITKLRDYLFDIINTLTTNRKYQINADMLGKVGDFSLDKIPTNTEVENWIIGIDVKKDVYSFRSRKAYSQDTINNLKNIGFFEEFESIIKSNNDEGILPQINNIESIKCLNCGTLNNVDGTQATFDIQIQITYRDNGEREVVSQ